MILKLPLNGLLMFNIDSKKIKLPILLSTILYKSKRHKTPIELLT